MKVLILSTSPRKGGNSDLLADEFMKGVIDAGQKAEKFILVITMFTIAVGVAIVLNIKAIAHKKMRWVILQLKCMKQIVLYLLHRFIFIRCLHSVKH